MTTLSTSPPSSHKGRVAPAPLAEARAPLFVLFLISLVSNLLMLTGPLFMLQIYDRVLASYSIPTLVALSLLVAGLYVFYAFIEWMRTRMAIRFAGMIDEALAGNLFRAAIRLKSTPGAGGRTDPVRDLDTLRQFAAGPGPLSIFDLPWMPVYLGIIFLFHPMLGWLSVGGAGIITLFLVINELSAQKPSQEVTLAAAKRQVQSDDARNNAESVLSMGMLESVTQRWMSASRTYVAVQHRAADWTAFYSSATKSFRFLLQSAVLAVGAYLVIQGEITAGLMIGASIVSSRALAPMEQVVAHWRGFVSARQALKRIRTVGANTKPAPKTELPLPSRSLVVRQLSTGSDPRRRPLLSDIAFSLEAGEGLGVLGLSGSGKTSLARALVGVWPVLQGEIRLDGSELAHYDPDRLGAAIGYLPQVVDLFDGTIAENIARFQPGASDNAILKAAAAAQTHELITSMPDGYDTRIGERGAILSAGQRQRIGLARALYGDPFLLVLDEPNSNLDSEGDAALTAALNSAKERGAIVVVIAHRPSAIVATDKILFLKGGRQAAFGPKDEVLRSITQNSAVATPAFGAARSYG